MTKFSNKLKKPFFWPIMGPYSQFRGAKKKKKEKENRNIQLCPRTTSHGILAPCQNLENINDTIPRTDGRMDRPYFIGHFRLPPRVQLSPWMLF